MSRWKSQTPLCGWISFAPGKKDSAFPNSFYNRNHFSYPPAQNCAHHACMMNQENAHSGANPEPTESSPEQTSAMPQGEAADDGNTLEVRDDETDEDRLSTASPEPNAPPRPSIPLPPPPPIPSGTLPLLDAQLGEALKIMQDLAAWVRHPYSAIDTCMSVADSVSRLVLASATLGKVASQLQNGDPESRHRVIVEYAGDRGEGIRKSRKRINRDGS